MIQLLQQLEALRIQLQAQIGEARDVPTWPGKVRDQTQTDGITHPRENDRNRLADHLGRLSRVGRTGNNDVDVERNELRGHPLENVPALLDRQSTILW